MKYRVLRRLLHEYFKGAGGDWSLEERSRWGSSGVYMAKILLAASVVEAAGESSRLALPYLQHYATGVYKGVYANSRQSKTWQTAHENLSRYARRGRQEQHTPLNMKQRTLEQAQSILIHLSTPTLLQCHARREHMSTRAVP